MPTPPLSALVLLSLWAAPALAQVPENPESEVDRRRTPVVEVVERARPAVVSIQSSLGRDPYWPWAGDQQTSGTGVVVYEDGYIVTNNHVVFSAVTGKPAEQITVTFDEADDDTVYAARIVSRVASEDLALLKIEGGPFPTVPMSEKDPLLGETVIAIGNALGHSHTVSTGIISGMHRDIEAGGLQFNNLLQTDASINPGNSGGPLLNIEGELVGINSAMTGQAENIGFAIPVARVRWVLSKELLSLDQAPSWLGYEVDPETFLVKSVVEGGPAELAGLRVADKVVMLNGQSFVTDEEYRRLFLGVVPLEKVEVAVEREGRRRAVKIPAWNRVDGLLFERLGIQVELIYLTVPRQGYQRFVRIREVQPGSPAASIYLQPGDIVAAVRPEKFRASRPESAVDLALKISRFPPGTRLDIEILRDDNGDDRYSRADSELYTGQLVLR